MRSSTLPPRPSGRPQSREPVRICQKALSRRWSHDVERLLSALLVFEPVLDLERLNVHSSVQFRSWAADVHVPLLLDLVYHREKGIIVSQTLIISRFEPTLAEHGSWSWGDARQSRVDGQLLGYGQAFDQLDDVKRGAAHVFSLADAALHANPGFGSAALFPSPGVICAWFRQFENEWV